MTSKPDSPEIKPILNISIPLDIHKLRVLLAFCQASLNFHKEKLSQEFQKEIRDSLEYFKRLIER